MQMNSYNEVIQIPIEDLIPNRSQPRIVFDEKALNDLANSIKQHGIIQPLIVRKINDKYEIIAGERRYKAAQLAGLISVPGLVADVSNQSSAEIALVENVQREDLTSIEEAKSYKNILDNSDLTQEELAKKMGLSQSAVSNKLRLLNLNEDVQKALLEGRISERHARSLLSIDNPDTQSNMLQRVIEERLTVKQLDEEIKKLKNPLRDSEMDDVPLVNMDNNLEQMQQEATDIAPTNTQISIPKSEPVPVNEEEHKENKFFKFSNMEEKKPLAKPELDLPSKQSEPSFFEFGKSVSNNELSNLVESTNAVAATPLDAMVEEVLDVDPPNANNEIETLDVDGISIFNPVSENNYENIVKEIKDYVSSVNPNIIVNEEDTGDTIKINIEIKKNV